MHSLRTPCTCLALITSTLLAPLASAYVIGDPILLANSKLQLDVNARLRYEARDNTFDFNKNSEAFTDDAFLLTRLRVGAKYTFSPSIIVYAQGQDARELYADRPTVPYVNASEGNDVFDLRQLYIDLGDPRDNVLTARLGRQVLAYGDERLIGGFEWNNLARTFDAVKLVYNAASWKTTVDAFAARVVTIQGRNLGDAHDWEFNTSDENDFFGGIYAQNSGVIPNQKTDLYLLYRDKDVNGPIYRPNTSKTNATGVAPYDIPQRIWTAGFRAQSISSARLFGFDYIVEAAYQWGESRPGLTTGTKNVPNWYDHRAYALHAELGYSIEGSPLVPRFAVEYNQASGDKNPSDTNNDSFLNLFHTNHKFYGYMDVLGWKNMKNAAVTARFKPLYFVDSSLKKSVLRLDYHWFWLQTTQDLWYRANAITPVFTPATNIRATLPRDLGQEFDLTWSWSPSPVYDFLIGYSKFYTGDYLPAARRVGNVLGRGDDAQFIYVQTTLKF
jgi:hypothetical protein